MGHISQDVLANIKIPIPPLEIQNKIASVVQARIARAEKLKKESSEVLEKAKAEVEQMILG